MEKQGGQIHYHIHWSNSKFDWQPFDTLESARIEAERLALPGETFTIDQFDGDCAHCLRPSRWPECQVLFERLGN